jgi:hypothetical protein
MRKKILIYASDNRGYIEVKNVVNELSQRECDYMFVYPTDGQFGYESNIDYFTYPNFESNSVGFLLPFKPDIVLITRESWFPETNIVMEFKQAGAIVCNLENSSWLYNNVKTRLEILSRMKFPTNMIDVFFDHSNWTYESKLEAGWVKGKSIVTGIPKFDILKNITTEDIKQKYDLTKPIIVLYGSMEDNIRPNIINISKELEDKYGSTHHLFYKPHPKEFTDFPNDFSESNLIPSPKFRVIRDENEMYSFSQLGDIHIGIITSVMYYPLYFNKSIYYINSDDSGVMVDMDLENFKGHEYNFWAPLMNVNSWDEFVDKIGEYRIENFKNRYNLFMNKFKNTLKPYKEIVDLNQKFEYDNNILLELYDEFNDGNASERIANYLINIYN